MYTSGWNVVFGEQPTASKWTELGQNCDALADGSAITNLEIGSVTALLTDYKFSAYLSSGAELDTGATTTLIIFDTKNYDTGTNYSTGDGAFTAPITGFYTFKAQMTIVPASEQTYYVVLFKNGVEISRGIEGAYSIADSTAVSYLVTDDLELNAGDAIQVYGYSGYTGSETGIVAGASVTRFSGRLISNS